MREAYKSPRRASERRTVARDASAPGTPTHGRELRAQGRKTMGRLLDAGMKVFADRGYHAARVDDIVRAARTSHGTFYLYFANKEDLLRALAVSCAQEMGDLAHRLGPIAPDAEGDARLREFLEGFLTTYQRYGPVIRAWMEGHVDDREVSLLGVEAFTDIASALGRRMREAGADGSEASISALMAMLERFAYFLTSRRLPFDLDVTLDTLAVTVHRGFFTPVAVTS